MDETRWEKAARLRREIAERNSDLLALSLDLDKSAGPNPCQFVRQLFNEEDVSDELAQEER